MAAILEGSHFLDSVSSPPYINDDCPLKRETKKSQCHKKTSALCCSIVWVGRVIKVICGIGEQAIDNGLSMQLRHCETRDAEITVEESLAVTTYSVVAWLTLFSRQDQLRAKKCDIQ